MLLANVFSGIIVSRVAGNGGCEAHGNTHLPKPALSAYCAVGLVPRFGFFDGYLNGHCLRTDISHSVAVILNRFCQASAQLYLILITRSTGYKQRQLSFECRCPVGLLGVIPSLSTLTGSAKLAD